jgi:prophage DNA circulation protein
MSQITDESPQPWRNELRMASFAGNRFHVEDGGKSSGRRIALHEYPKRDLPFSEDMGRRTRIYDVVGYIIEADRRLGMDYRSPRDALIKALEAGPGTLVMPTLRGADNDLQCYCERYSIRESRDKGGYCIFEMRFIEAGQAASQTTTQNTAANVNIAAAASDSQASASFNTSMNNFVLGRGGPSSVFNPPPAVNPQLMRKI